jgi:hypothetical protein
LISTEAVQQPSHVAFIFGFTPRQQTQDFVRRMREIGSTRIPRALQFALNGVALDAAKKAPAAIDRTLDRPTPWSMRAFFAEKGKLGAASGKSLDQISSAIRVKDQQSVVFKYLLGGEGEENGKRTRRPGDVGLARKAIYLPIWSNLKKLGIKPNARGNLPKTALGKISPCARPSNTRRAGRSSATTPTTTPGMARPRSSGPRSAPNIASRCKLPAPAFGACRR